MLIAALFVSAVITRLPQALSDYAEARKAAAAGEWGHLKGMRESRDAATAARADRRGKWAERIYDDWQARDRGEKRPGFWAWLGEVWHGAWEDTLAQREARRAAREPFDPATPTWRDRAFQWGKAKAEGWKRKKVASESDVEPERPGCVDVVPDEPEPTANQGERWQQKCLWQVDGYGCGAPAAVGDIYCPPHVAEADTRQASENRSASPRQADEKPSTAEHPDTSDDNGGSEMTAPATVDEVATNEGARRALKQMQEGAAELGEAAAAAEAAKAKIQAAAQAAGDAMSAKAFDRGATDAVNNINDIVSNDNLSAMSAAADEIGAAASKGLNDLKKYQDSEDLVAEERVDPTTLAPTQS